jgi:hypothetical protein
MEVLDAGCLTVHEVCGHPRCHGKFLACHAGCRSPVPPTKWSVFSDEAHRCPRGVLALAIAAPASAAVVPGAGLTTAASTGAPAAAGTARAAAVTAAAPPVQIVPGQGLVTAASAGATPAVP